MKSLDLLIKIALEKQKVDLDQANLKEKIMQQAAQVKSDKDIKMIELVNKVIEQEIKQKGES